MSYYLAVELRMLEPNRLNLECTCVSRLKCVGRVVCHKTKPGTKRLICDDL